MSRNSKPSHSLQSSVASRIGGAIGTVAYGAAGAVGAVANAAAGTTCEIARFVVGGNKSESFSSATPNNVATQNSSQIVTVPRGLSTPLIKDGIIEKWTNYLCAWKQRYFIVEPGVLKYANAFGQSIKETFPLNLCRTQLCSSDPLRIEIQHPRGVLHLRLLSFSDRKPWIDAILKAKNMFYQHELNSTLKSKVDEMRSPNALNNVDTDLASYSFDGLFESEKSPMELLSDACVTYKQTVQGAITDVQKLQSTLLNLVSQIKDSDTRSEINSLLLKIIEIVDYIQIAVNRHIVTTEMIVHDEGVQRKALQHHIRMLAKKNYSMRYHLQDVQRYCDESNVNLVGYQSTEITKLLAKTANLIDSFDLNDSTVSESNNEEETGSQNHYEDNENDFFDVEEAPASTQIDRNGIERRTELPRPRSDVKKSLWSVLKDCIGKDLSRVALPIYFSEPTSFLQRLTEDFQYSYLLDKAATFDDPIKRLLYVTVFSISPAASTVGRTYKPMNPLLGETYEMSHRGFKFVSEQVGHHPPVSAYHVHNNSFTAWGHVTVNNRFTGKSLEIMIPGNAHILLYHPNAQKTEPDHYAYQRTKTLINNVIFGKLAIEMIGSVLITNFSTGDFSYVEYVRQGWWSHNPCAVRALVYDKHGYPRYHIGGQWNSELWVEELPGNLNSHKKPDSINIFHTPEQPTLPFPPQTTPKNLDSFPLAVTATKPIKPPNINARNPANFRVDWNSLPVNPTRTVIWSPDPRLPNASKFYEFSQFTVELNELSLDYDVKRGAVMPLTDSRFRPDQRLLENGEYEKADAEKRRLEEKQRNNAKGRFSELDYQPRWFYRGKDIVSQQTAWLFTGEYWEAKKNKNFSNCPDIFS